MIPIRDNLRARHSPVVTGLIIAINLAVFGYELTLSNQGLAGFTLKYGAVPARLTKLIEGLPSTAPYAAPVLLSLITAMFVHGGWLHVLGNMLYLWVFGDNVEDRLGRGRFLVFYLATGFVGFAAQALANPLSPVPAIGASGAIAGVLGAYFLAFPQSRVLALVPLGFFVQLAEIPAIFFLFVWFLLQVVSGVAAVNFASRVSDTVAWWAHVGGFVSGMILLVAMGRVRRRRSETP